MGDSTKTTSSATNSTTSPSGLQLPYLQQAFQGAQTALGQAQSNGSNAPTNFTAQYTPAMMQAFQSELGYGTGNSNIPGSSAAAGGALTGAGSDAASKGLYGLSNFTPQGGTQYNIDAANQYVQGQDIPGQTAAAMRDANQNFTDVTNPAIMRQAAGSGNINSTAPSIQQGIVERGLAQKSADISSTLRNSAFSQGLGLAQNQSQNNNQSVLSALMGAANGGTSAATAGVGANSGAVGQQTGLFDIANAGASNINSGNQAGLTNAGQQYAFGQSSPFTALQNYYNLIGNKAWGQTQSGTSNGTETSTPSTMQMVGSGLGIAGSLFV